MPRPSLTHEEAASRAAQHGYVPLERYPGKTRLPWRVKCTTCQQPRVTNIARLALLGACTHRTPAPPASPAAAAAEMRAAGYRPVTPYPGNVTAMWQVLCEECKQPRSLGLAQVRAGRRCRHQRTR